MRRRRKSTGIRRPSTVRRPRPSTAKRRLRGTAGTTRAAMLPHVPPSTVARQRRQDTGTRSRSPCRTRNLVGSSQSEGLGMRSLRLIAVRIPSTLLTARDGTSRRLDRRGTRFWRGTPRAGGFHVALVPADLPPTRSKSHLVSSGSRGMRCWNSAAGRRTGVAWRSPGCRCRRGSKASPSCHCCRPSCPRRTPLPLSRQAQFGGAQ